MCSMLEAHTVLQGETASEPWSKGGSLPDRLEHLVGRSIDRANELLDLPLEPGSPSFPAVVRANTTLIGTALSTQARVDETNLKREKKGNDVMAELIELIREAKASDPDRYGSDPV